MSIFTLQEFQELHINELELHKFVLTADGHVAIRVLGGTAGDMLKAIYDPNLIEGDVFDMDNMQEGSDTKIMTAAERIKLGLALTTSDIVTTVTAGKLWDSVKINTEIGSLNTTLSALIAGKESAFAKNTGFNKNFGTTAGTVSEGNHIHDDRYFTETEVTNLIANAKAEAITQAKNDITGGAASAYDTLLEIQNQLQSDDTDIAGLLTGLGTKIDKVTSQSGKFARFIANGNLEAIDPTTTMVAEGTNLYFTETRVRSTPLTGFTASNSAIVATDTVLQAFNKAQGQISARALDSAVVHTTGNESINGQKIFEGQVYIRGGLFAQGNATGQTTGSDIASFKLHNTGNGAIWSIRNKPDTGLAFEYHNGASRIAPINIGSDGSVDFQGGIVSISKIIPAFGSIDLGWYQDIDVANGSWSLNKSVNGGYSLNVLKITEGGNVGISTNPTRNRLDVYGSMTVGTYNDTNSIMMGISNYGAATGLLRFGRFAVGDVFSDLLTINPRTGITSIFGRLQKYYETTAGSGSNMIIGSRYEFAGILHASMGHMLEFLWGDLSATNGEGSGNDGGWGLQFGPNGNPYLQMIAETTRVGRRGGNLDTMGVLRHYGYATGSDHIAMWDNGTEHLIEGIGKRISFGTTAIKMSLTTTVPGVSGQLYKDASGFVKIVA